MSWRLAAALTVVAAGGTTQVCVILAGTVPPAWVTAVDAAVLALLALALLAGPQRLPRHLRDEIAAEVDRARQAAGRTAGNSHREAP